MQKRQQHSKLKIIKFADHRTVVLHSERKYKSHQGYDSRVGRAVVIEIKIKTFY